ncbi:MAG: hypothetical protein JXR71_12215 [Bacteroidales bacterium]|nr:hypothetical protein [Bacteroidales bacterium]
MLIVAHRGASGTQPENTPASFQKALDAGAKALELDVHVCRSGELVVIHDETVNRTTNGKGKIADLTLTELQQLDAGNGEKIPTLQEVLDLVQGRAQINIELKGKHTARPVADLIKHNTAENIWHTEDFLISSFYHKELNRFHRLLPEVRIGILYSFRPFFYKAKARKLHAFSLHLSAKMIHPSRVDRIHRQGLQVWVYTVNDTQTLERISDAGADAVFTNFPEQFI